MTIQYIRKNYSVITFVLFLLLYLGFGSLFILFTNTFKAPDERMHYYYVKTVGQTGKLPVITSEKVTKESHQPPLYYWLVQPIYQLTKSWSERGSVVALRFFGLIISSTVIIMTYFMMRKLFLGNDLISLTATALVALNPQFIYMSGIINNDVLTNMLAALCLLLLILFIVKGGWNWVRTLVFCLVGTAAFLTKTVLWPFVSVLFITALWRSGKKQLLHSLLVFSPLYAVMVWWLARNQRLYGSLTGFNYLKDLWYSEQHRDFLNLSGIWNWLKTLYESFWARFGYFDLALPRVYYVIVEVLGLLAIIGFIAFLFNKFKIMDKDRRASILLMIILAAVILVGVFGYNLSFYQPQGRYMFSIIGIYGLIMAVGLLQLLPRFLKKWGSAALIMFLLIINWQSLLIIKTYG